MPFPLPPNPTPHSRLLHPVTGQISFGTVPELALKLVTLPRGVILLPYGRREFGAVHIHDRHRTEMARKGFATLAEVPAFVALILRPHAPLFLEIGTRDVRLAVVQSVSGTVILQLRQPERSQAYYSVVTAYLGFNRHGPRIGRLE